MYELFVLIILSVILELKGMCTIVLAILTAILTAAAEEIRERLKNKKPKK